MNLKTPNILPNCSVILTVLWSGTNVKRLPGRHEWSINKTINRFFQVTNLLVPNIRIVLWVVLIPNTVSDLPVSIDNILTSEIFALSRNETYRFAWIPCHVADVDTLLESLNVPDCGQVVSLLPPDGRVSLNCDSRNVGTTPRHFAELLALLSAIIIISFLRRLRNIDPTSNIELLIYWLMR